MEGSQRGERAGSLPPRLQESPRRTGAEKEGEARERRREGGKGRQERGSEEGSLQARKEGKTQPPESSEITSRTQAAAERARARARVLSVVWGQTAPRLARSTPPKHCLVLSAPAAP